MSFALRVENELKRQNKNASDMLKDLGLAVGFLSTCKSRGTTPGGEYVAKIAVYLGVSTDYLLGVDGLELTQDALSPEKAKLINEIKSMTDEQVALLLRLAESLLVP